MTKAFFWYEDRSRQYVSVRTGNKACRSKTCTCMGLLWTISSAHVHPYVPQGRYCGSGTAGKDLSPYYICNMPYGSRYLLQGRDAKEKLWKSPSDRKRIWNVYIDTSTVPDYYEEEYPWKTSVNIIEECYRKVGADKMMWASDYPGMLKKGTLNQLIRLVTEECKNIPESAKEKIMAENARRLFFKSCF